MNKFYIYFLPHRFGACVLFLSFANRKAKFLLELGFGRRGVVRIKQTLYKTGLCVNRLTDYARIKSWVLLRS